MVQPHFAKLIAFSADDTYGCVSRYMTIENVLLHSMMDVAFQADAQIWMDGNKRLEGDAYKTKERESFFDTIW